MKSCRIVISLLLVMFFMIQLMPLSMLTVDMKVLNMFFRFKCSITLIKAQQDILCDIVGIG